MSQSENSSRCVPAGHGLHLAKVIAELSERVAFPGQAEAGEDGPMDVGGPPSVELRAGMQEHLHRPHHASVMNFDAGDFGFAGWDGQRDRLTARKVDVTNQR